jgi:hypothetical protein
MRAAVSVAWTDRPCLCGAPYACVSPEIRRHENWIEPTSMMRRRNNSRSIVASTGWASAFLLLAGCNVGPDYHAPSMTALKIPAGFHAAGDAAASPVVAEPVDLARWWQGFDDPVLTELVDRAFTANLDIDAAGARLRQARATVRGTLGTALPSASVGGSVNRTIGSQSSTFIDPSSGQTITSHLAFHPAQRRIRGRTELYGSAAGADPAADRARESGVAG